MKKTLAIIFCLMMLVGCQAPKPEIKDYVLASIDDATTYFDEKGIPYIVSYIFNDEVEEGFIISQETMTEGYEEETVLLVVSSGHEPFFVEDLTGMSEEKLKEKIAKLNEKCFYYNGRIEYIENCAEETGIVISQSPKDESYNKPVEVVYLVSKKSENCPVEEAPVVKPITSVQKPAIKPSTQNNNTSTGETSKSDNNNTISNDKTDTSNNKDTEVEKPSSQPTEDKKEYQNGDVIQTEAGNYLRYEGKTDNGNDGTTVDSWTMIPNPDYETPDTEKVVELEDGRKVTQHVIEAGWEIPDNLPSDAVFDGYVEASEFENLLNPQN